MGEFGSQLNSMNVIAVQGYIRDIQFSHDIGNIDYYKANIACPGVNGREDDLIYVRFKNLSNKYKDGDFISFKGNLRSYSTKDDNGKSQVQIYVFTYFDLPDIPINTVQIDGRICKISALETTHSNKEYVRFILANNIIKGNKKINSYIPCIAYGDLAKQMSKKKVSDKILIDGELHSHTYKRKPDKEIIVAHEVIVKSFTDEV